MHCSTNRASTLGMYDIRRPILDTCSTFPATFALFPVLSHGYAHAQLSSFFPFVAAHVRKITALLYRSAFQSSNLIGWVSGFRHIIEILCHIHLPLLHASFSLVPRLPRSRTRTLKLYRRGKPVRSILQYFSKL